MIAPDTQFDPLSYRMRTAVFGLSHAAAVIFVSAPHLLMAAIFSIAPIAFLVAGVDHLVSSFLLICGQTVVLAMVTSAHLVGVARIGAMPMLVVTRARAANWAAPINRVRGLMKSCQRLFITTLRTALCWWRGDLVALSLYLFDIARQPFSLVRANAHFTAIAVSIAAALVFIELVKRLFNCTFRAAFEVWYSGHIGLQSRSVMPRQLTLRVAFRASTLYHRYDI